MSTMFSKMWRILSHSLALYIFFTHIGILTSSLFLRGGARATHRRTSRIRGGMPRVGAAAQCGAAVCVASEIHNESVILINIHQTNSQTVMVANICCHQTQAHPAIFFVTLKTSVEIFSQFSSFLSALSFVLICLVVGPAPQSTTRR